MIQFTKLLCPVDLSDASRRALEYAAVLARWYASSVAVLHVLPVMWVSSEYAVVPGAPVVEREERNRIRARVEALAREALGDVPHDVVLEDGYVAEQILSAADRAASSLIVMGAHGRRGLHGLALGSVTEKVVRRTARPVLIVPPHADRAPSAPGPFTSIVCAVDLTDGSTVAVDYAAALAREAGSPLTLVHVLDWPGDHDPIELLSPILSEYRRRREGDAAERLDALAARGRARGASTVSRVLAQGKPYREIARVANDVIADLIVLGVRGDTIPAPVFGSTAQRVLREAPCPILAVHGPAA